MKKGIKTAILIVLALLAERLYSRTEVIAAEAENQIKVVDGDSLEIKGKRIRLAGIDSPEYRQHCYEKSGQKYACGLKARDYMKKLISAGNVKCVEKGIDRYKRSLSVCYAGERDLNREMVRAGWAVAYRDDDNAYRAAEKYARKHHKGVWQGKFMRPELYRFLNK